MRFRKPSKKAIGVSLLGLAAVAIFLPPRWTGRLSALTQVLAPAQHAADSLAEVSADQLVKIANPPVPHQRFQAALDRTTFLERRLASATEQIRRLQRATDELTGLRKAGLPPNITLIPARVIAVDPASWRDVRMLNRGANRSVRKNEWVTTRTLIPERSVELASGMPVLAGEALLGRIELANPFSARLILLSDISYDRLPVRVVSSRRQDPASGKTMRAASNAEFLLRGKGNGLMELYEVHFQYVENKQIQVGDIVVTADTASGLPIPLTIGEITKIEKPPDRRLLYTCQVKPPVEYNTVRKVYIVQVGQATDGPKG